MKLKETDKLNSVVYMNDNNIMLFSTDMNMSAKQYCDNCPDKGKKLYNETWTLHRKDGKLEMYKADSGDGSIVLIKN